MLNIDLQTINPEENSLQVTYIMREICGPHDVAITEKFEMSYGTGFSVEELIASCAVDGALAFFQKYGKKSELTYIRIEKEY